MACVSDDALVVGGRSMHSCRVCVCVGCAWVTQGVFVGVWVQCVSTTRLIVNTPSIVCVCIATYLSNHVPGVPE